MSSPVPCKFCSEPSVSSIRLGKLEAKLCVRHLGIAKATGKEVVHTAARLAGQAVQHRFPLAYETGAAIFAALRAAKERDESVGGEV